MDDLPLKLGYNRIHSVDLGGLFISIFLCLQAHPNNFLEDYPNAGLLAKTMVNIFAIYTKGRTV